MGPPRRHPDGATSIRVDEKPGHDDRKTRHGAKRRRRNAVGEVGDPHVRLLHGREGREQLALEWTAVDARSKIVSFSRSRTRGAPLRPVQDWLGHSTIMMTMRYAHLAPTEQARKYLAALDAPAAARDDAAAQ
jgi:integrase